MHKIVIIGGGFVGVRSARQLQKQLGSSAHITLVSQTDRFLFTPRLIDVLMNGDDALAKFTTGLDTLARRDGFSFVRAEATEIRRDAREVVCRHVISGVQTTIPYDVLILSQGAQTSWYNIPGAKEHTCTLKTIEDVKCIHTHIEELLKRDAPPSISVVGGGATGIEMLFALKEYLDLRLNATGSTRTYNLQLIQGAPQILPGFPSRIVNGVMQECEQQQIKVILNEPVTSVSKGHITTPHHPDLPADLILWAGGVAPNAITTDPPLHTDPTGWLVVDRFLMLEPHIFAAGDIVKYAEKNLTIPKNAQTAMLMAQTIAKNITRSLRGESLAPFHYRSKGNILITGHTGYLDFKLFSCKNKLTPMIRDIFYRFRQWEVTG